MSARPVQPAAQPAPRQPAARTPDQRFAGCLLVDEHGRYLMQLRDDIPGILNPGAWGMFGGHVEPGEEPLAAMARELEEEIGFVPADLRPYRTLRMPLDRGGASILAEIHVFEGSIEASRVPHLVQTEGAGRGLFPAFRYLAEPRISRPALVAMATHAQERLEADGAPFERWRVG